ncbi:MAG: hypothetical protein NZM65_03820 [Flavobacteriales bacterium]|nr:hypothetical protein [Flavobacteriales bacterium]MDW8409797.1 hypothetical protein [Flavobacteriales bacterium]
MNELTKPKSKKNYLRGGLFVGFLVSLLFNFWQFRENVQLRHQKEIVQAQCDTVAFRKAELEREVASITEDLNRFKGQSERLDSLLEEAHKKIENQKREIARLIEENKDYQVLKARYADLRRLKDRYLAQIDSLMAENKKLKRENLQLSVQVDRLREEKEVLGGKVEMASALKLRNIRLRALQVRASGRIKDVNKAARTDRLNIRFEVQENELAKKGPHTAYVRILSPQGFVMTDINQSTRKFKIRDGRELPFSRVVEFDYMGNAVSLEVDYDQEIFSPGTYKVEVYIDSDFAGSEQITLE